jgi:GntR family transcriptional regulator/MocR family aminotransferase
MRQTVAISIAGWNHMTTSAAAMKASGPAYLPSILVDAGKDEPLYRQIYGWFREAILSGQLPRGQSVPSTRSLALHLGISRAPVLAAFEMLLAEGYLESRVGSGTRVNASLPEHTGTRQVGCEGDDRSQLNPPARGTPASRKWNRDDPWWRCTGAFRVGVSDTRHFPVNIWSALMARHARAPASRTIGPMGYWPLRVAICDYLRAARSVRCTPDQVMVVGGTQQGLQIAAHVLLGPRDEVWVEEPGCWGASNVLRSTGANLVPVPVDLEGLDVGEGMRHSPGGRAAYVSPTHQFPMGCAMSIARRRALLDWAARNDAWILEDDYDSEFRYDGQPIPSLQSLDAVGRVIFLGTFGKVVAPAERIAYMVIPETLLATFREARQAIDLASPTLIQQILAEFMQSGHFARHIRRLKQVHAAQRQALISAVRQFMGDDMAVAGTDAGLHLVGLLPSGVDDVGLGLRLADAGISAVPLSTCYLGQPVEPGLVLGYGSVDVDAIAGTTKALATVLQDELARAEPVPA